RRAEDDSDCRRLLLPGRPEVRARHPPRRRGPAGRIPENARRGVRRPLRAHPPRRAGGRGEDRFAAPGGRRPRGGPAAHARRTAAGRRRPPRDQPPASRRGTAPHTRPITKPQCDNCRMHIRIATRRSELALWQARDVAARLEALPSVTGVELLPMTTRGDRTLDRSLYEIGGKGLFIKELEVAMQDGRADVAVHSMKDVPAEMPEGFVIAAVLERGNPFDALL